MALFPNFGAFGAPLIDTPDNCQKDRQGRVQSASLIEHYWAISCPSPHLKPPRTPEKALIPPCSIQYTTLPHSAGRQRVMSPQNLSYVLRLAAFQIHFNFIALQGASTTVVGSKMYLFVGLVPVVFVNSLLMSR
jgi:hypothetical protein